MFFLSFFPIQFRIYIYFLRLMIIRFLSSKQYNKWKSQKKSNRIILGQLKFLLFIDIENDEFNCCNLKFFQLIV